MTPRGQSHKDVRMRREGYADGYALVPAQRTDAVYQRAWRRGYEQRNADARREINESVHVYEDGA